LDKSWQYATATPAKRDIAYPSTRLFVGHKYHPLLKCNLADMRECRSISQRLLLSLDEWLKKYIQENDIVNIKFDENGLAAAFDDVDEDDEENERTQPPVELDNAVFPDINGSFNSDEDNADKVAYFNDAVKDNAQEDRKTRLLL
jgi:hypothetical protein